MLPRVERLVTSRGPLVEEYPEVCKVLPIPGSLSIEQLDRRVSLSRRLAQSRDQVFGGGDFSSSILVAR